MPLHPGHSEGVISKNIKEMQDSGHSHEQSVAAALHNADEYARGGRLGVMRPAKLHEPHYHGLFGSSGAGRTDNMNVSVPHNSYIVPADVVSGLGQGNTLAGAKTLDHLTGGDPSGGKSPASLGTVNPGLSAPFGHSPLKPLASGGMAKFSKGGLVPIVVAGGEYHIHPEAVERIGKGSMKAGHQILDAFVKHVRKKTTKEMSKLPGPKKD